MQELLGVIAQNAIEVQLSRTHLAIEERRGDQVFEIIIGLFLGLGKILVAKETAAGDLVGELKDLCDDCRNVFRSYAMFAALRSASVVSITGWPCTSAQYFLKTVLREALRLGSLQSIDIV